MANQQRALQGQQDYPLIFYPSPSVCIKSFGFWKPFEIFLAQAAEENQDDDDGDESEQSSESDQDDTDNDDKDVDRVSSQPLGLGPDADIAQPDQRNDQSSADIDASGNIEIDPNSFATAFPQGLSLVWLLFVDSTLQLQMHIMMK